MNNAEPNRETNGPSSPESVPSHRTLQNRTLHAPDTASLEVRETIDRTQDCDLFATLKSGTATVETLKLLIPGFELLEELGRGAFGVVYRARDEALDRQVAIKVSLIDDPKRREQYIKEARSAAKIDTQGIVTVFQVGTLAGGQPFVVQRLIEGGTLRQALAKSGSLDVRQVCWLMSEIAAVVAKAHALGMIHRDIKPDNILIDAGGQPWVADFGLAIHEEDQSEQAGERAGTPLYMSPEQLCGRVDWLDGRTDIYAMGVMLYEMLVGRTPFDARNLAELEQQVLHRDPKPISQRAPHVPPELDEIFGKCCAKRVEDRYANANALVDDLQSLLAELSEGESIVSPFASESRYVPLSERRGGSSRGASHSASRISGRRKTLRQSSALDETLELKRPKPLWQRLAVPSSILLFAICLGGLMLWRSPKLTPPEQPSAEATLPAVIPPTSPSPEPEESQAPKTPDRPFRVSKASDATHHTIAAAIAAAEVGETITILPGTYFESLQVDRAVRLVGEGSREDIVIVGEDRSALVVECKEPSEAVASGEPSTVIELVNLTLEGNKTGQENFNTIEVKRGSLTLSQCNVNSRSWDCVKLLPQSSFNAKFCRFRSSTHPAISARQTSGLFVADCNFDIRPLTLDSPSIPLGIQASDSAGLVQRCTFVGSGAANGIHWNDTNQHVSIEDASFQNCEIGLLAQACSDIHVNGSTGTHFSGCGNGLLLEGCTAVIDGADIQCAEGKIGIRIVDQAEPPQAAKVQLNHCTVSGYETGLSIEHAHVSALNLKCERSIHAGVQLVRKGQLRMETSIISANDNYGIYVQDAIANIFDCDILNSGYVGVYLDASSAGSNFKQCTLAQNQVGVLIVAGAVELEQCDYTSNSVGVLVSTYEKLELDPPAEVLPVSIAIVGGEFQKNSEGHLQVWGPCQIALDGWDGVPPSEMPTPNVIEGLNVKLEKNVYEIRDDSRKNNAL
jgi:serine/threonine protein kinase